MNLEISMGGTQEQQNFAPMEQTWRKEGLSVGEDHMRLFGEEIHMEVGFSDLILGARLGHGACSTVNLARHRRTGESFAIKMFNVYDKGQASQLFNEILLLTSFQCDALISLKGAFHDEGAIGVIIEYMDRGSLEGLMKEHVVLSEQVMGAIAFQIVWGLGYLHYEKQIHRDIKPGNILINSYGQVKLSDFGISKELDNSVAMSNTAIGTYRYMSPERLRGDKYDGTGDIWSVGITIIELWTKKYPFSHVADTPISLLGEFENISFAAFLSRYSNSGSGSGGSFSCSNGGFSRTMSDFLLCLLDVEPARRVTSERLMGAPWFDSCGVCSLVDAHAIVEPWIREMDRRAQRNSIDSNSSSIAGRKPPMHLSSSRGAGGSFKKDINEMSISMDSSRSSYNGNPTAAAEVDACSMSVSRDRLSGSLTRDNPYTSSGHLGSSISIAERYRSTFDIGQAPAEENYEDDRFEEDYSDNVEPYNDYKSEEKKSDYYRRK